MAETAVDRLARMLSIVTYVHGKGRVLLSELVERFNVSERQLRADLELMWMTGLPGYAGGDLIDVHVDDDTVSLSNVEHMGITRPLRLTTDEAIALLVGIEALAAAPALHDSEVVAETGQILRDAVGEAAAAAEQVRLQLVDDEGSRAARDQVGAVIRLGMAQGRRLEITYVSAADQTSTREVDPLQLFTADGNVYLRAWCYAATDERLFRLDRIGDVTILEQPAAVTNLARAGDGPFGAFEGDEVTITVRTSASWVLPYLNATNQIQDGATVRATINVADRAWFRGLLLSLGGEVVDVQPPTYLTEARRVARQALAAYEALGQ